MVLNELIIVWVRQRAVIVDNELKPRRATVLEENVACIVANELNTAELLDDRERTIWVDRDLVITELSISHNRKALVGVQVDE